MGTPDRIRALCQDFRALFSSDADMALALRVDLKHAQGMVEGKVYPSLDVMIGIQAALRHHAIGKKRTVSELMVELQSGS
jgi:hypothetical protein